MANKFLEYLIVLTLFLSILQTTYLVREAYQVEKALKPRVKAGGAAYGLVKLCINAPPTIIVPCANNATQGVPYSCVLNATDPDEPTSFTYNSTLLNYSLTFDNSTNKSLFTVTPSGIISFTPDNDDVGNYTFLFTVTDNSSCPNGNDSATFNLEVLNANDPPYLSAVIPNVSILKGEAISPFFLKNHFADPDRDPLTFNVSGAEKANITIANNSEVRIRSEKCDFEEAVVFTAKDPYGEVAESNPVIIRCATPKETVVVPPGAIVGGGGGGGGGGLPCKADFDCFDITKCRTDNTKLKRCVDINGCQEEEEFVVECSYEEERKKECLEDWLCGDWGPCLLNNTQYRDCVDLNDCGTSFDKPNTSRTCTYVPTCDDGVKNGNETGVDCGGPCPPCKHIETPSPLPRKRSVLTSFLIALLLVALLTSLTYKYAHKQLYMALAKLGLQFAGRVKKQVLLTDQDRDSLLAELKELEGRVGEEALSVSTVKWVSVAKEFFTKALSLESDSTKEDLLAKCEEERVNEHLLRVLASFFDKAFNVEFATQPLTLYEAMYLVEELRELVLETSNHAPDLVEASVTEYSIPEYLYPLEKVYLKLFNAYKALQFNEIDSAVEKYLDLLDFYESLTVEEQDAVYHDLSRLYQKIRYRASWISNA